MPEIEAQELDQRLTRIRLPVKELSRRVGCDQATIAGHKRGVRRMNDRLQRDVVGVLVGEEIDLLDYLLRLHPEAARARLPQLAA